MAKPIRMCICCKERFFQKELLRFVCNKRKIEKFKGTGRSFYICKDCLNSKKLKVALSKICKKDKQSALNMLKELLGNGES
jgi:predicted RNA-binding protein YlxR (DUF448 family)